MYLDYWGLTRYPFENTPDPEFFFESRQHQEGLARIRYVVEANKGAALLSGVFGCGKTLIARSLIHQLEQSRYRLAYLSNPRMSAMELLYAIATKLQVTSLPERRSEVLLNRVLSSIEFSLNENARDGKQTVIILDEAHLIEEREVLEQIRLLLNFQTDSEFLLTLILIGQPELKDLIDRHKPLAQRIAMGFHLEPLTEEETGAYLEHRLSIAGARSNVFDNEAAVALRKHSGGIPRRLNQLADMSMIAGMEKRSEVIDAMIVKDAVESVGV